jgi:hypothetical protein
VDAATAQSTLANSAMMETALLMMAAVTPAPQRHPSRSISTKRAIELA